MARLQLCDSLLPSQGFLWLLLLGLGLLPSASSDYCGRPTLYFNMEPDTPVKHFYAPMERINYRCKPGYLSRPSLITLAVCAPNGWWSPVSTDACYRDSCDLQLDLVHGHVILVNKSYELGSQVTFVCNDGFYLIGNRILHCLLNESKLHWSGDAPVCKKVSCQPPPQIPHGGYSSKKTVFQYLESVTYSCHHNPGPEEFSLVGERQLFCLGKEVWSGSPPECKVVSCPKPAVPNGRQKSGFGGKHYYRAIVTFECLQGFFLHGNSTVVCAADSTWQPPVPQCLDTPPVTKPRPSLRPLLTSTSKGPPSSESQGMWTVLLAAAYFITVVVLCTYLYFFIKSRK